MKNLLTIIFFIFPLITNAQLGEASNGNPPTIKWKEISNESARIIFPESLDERAFRVADVIDYLNKNNRTSLGKPKGKINIILQNQLTKANGFVTAAPFRSEFFTTAPQRTFAGTVDWLDLLAIHEYRHVMQFQFAKQGATKIGSILLGDAGWQAMAILAVPLWFLEGDAVMQETLLSEGGRGRSAAFLAEYRAMHEAKVRYPYEKIRNRSFKHILPDRYRMGYLFSKYGRTHYGNDLWKDVGADAVKYKGLFWSFSQSLEKRTGKNVHHFYEVMMDSVYQKWDLDNKAIDWVQADEQLRNKKIKKDKATYYFYPKFIDEKILTLKSGRDRIPAFYTIDAKFNEQKIFNLGYHDYFFNYKNGKMVWTQSKVDIRWGNKTFSNIYIYDFNSKERKKLTSKAKFFSPDINADGTHILVVNSDEKMQYQILVLDAKNGRITETIPNPKNIFLSTPKWLNEHKIIAIAQLNQKNALMEIDIQTGKMIPIIDYTNNLILHPEVKGDYVYFSGDFTDVRNVFAIDRGYKKVFQVTNSRVLAEQPCVSENGTKMLYREQQINGKDIKEIELDKSKWKEINTVEPLLRYSELDLLASQEDGNILNKIPQQKYKVEPYKKTKDAINLHSWVPSLEESNAIGVRLNSTNLLSTLNINVTPSSNFDHMARLETNIVWNKYFPRFSLNHDILKFDTKDRMGKRHPVLQNRIDVGIDLPLNFSKNDMNRNLTIGTSAGFLDQSILDEYNVLTDQIFTLGAEVSFSSKQQKAFQQLESTLGTTFDISLENRFHTFYSGRDLALQTNLALFFPGFARTHSTIIKGHHFTNFDRTNIYNFSANGLRALTTNLAEINNVVSVDYAFPIAYPDFGLGPILFVKRLRANLFYEYGRSTIVNSFREVHSLGVELEFDTGIFNFGSTFTLPIGLRMSYSKIDNSDEYINFQILIFQ